MRITTLLILLFIISQSSFSQQKGNILIGGTLGFFKAKEQPEYDSTTRSNYVNFSPSVGKFYKTNRMAGVNIYISRYNDKRHLNKQSNYGAGFFLRQYQPLGKSFFVFAEEGINLRFGKNESRYIYGAPVLQVEKSQTASVYFYPGLAYGLNKRLQLELALTQLLSLEYSHGTYEIKDSGVPSKRERNNFGMSAGFSQYGLGNLAFGVKWLLPG